MLEKIKHWLTPRPKVPFDPSSDVLFVYRPDGSSHTHGPYSEDPGMMLVAGYLFALFGTAPGAIEARRLLRSTMTPEFLAAVGELPATGPPGEGQAAAAGRRSEASVAPTPADTA